MTVTAILGKKIGMTQLFTEDGRIESATAIEAGPCTVTQVKTMQKDGYDAVQVGFEEAGRLNKPQRGHLHRSGKLFRLLRELKVETLEEVQVGQQTKVDMFKPGDLIDVIGTSIGKGFAGGVKRHHFSGGPKTHGQSDRQRAPGSVGATTFPGRVWKGQRMAGHLGSARITVRNLEVIEADPERNLLLVKGAVPGPSNGLLIIRKAIRPHKR
ncbi:MAG: 50S ribosomal protein L3 [Chloroflexi bacterium]|nr:50S ribosomal protein L3 [Chloroflexota bacterium]